MMKTVYITHTYGDYSTLISKHRSESTQDAIEKALKKHYGAGAYWNENGNLKGFGQVVKGDGSCITGQVNITVLG